MQDHVEIAFENLLEEQIALLVAFLTELGYDGFLETTTTLKAYITKDQFDEVKLLRLADSLSVSYVKSILHPVNWNATWESNFEPVLVDDFVSIRASFHPKASGVLHDIIITPKMSFGTGHHSTTQLMVKLMKDINFKGKQVFDFGTGTGVLAILAEKLGASRILAIDNDNWSVENAIENKQANGCYQIEILLEDKPPFTGNFDVILANINKSILLRFMRPIQNLMATQGELLLSGLLEDDLEDILAAASANSLKLIEKQSDSGWIALKLGKE